MSDNSVTESSSDVASRREMRGEREEERKRVRNMRIILFYGVGVICLIAVGIIVFATLWGADDTDWFHPKCSHFCASKYFAKKATPLLIISLSGFPSYYLSSARFLTLNRMKTCGASAERVIPSFPLKTFPNYATIATGFFPGQHGIVSDSVFKPNIFNEPVEITPNMTEELFYKEPIWSIFKKAMGGKVASFFWMGPFSSNSPYQQPDYHMEFDPSKTDKEQLDHIVDWLKLPWKTRPNLMLIHFDHAKYIGYHHSSKKQLHKVLDDIDALLGTLFMKLNKQKILHCLNIAVISDAGIVPSSPQAVVVDTSAAGKWAIEPGSTALLHLLPRAKEVANVDVAVKEIRCKSELFHIYTKETQPPRWHYDHQKMGGDLIFVGRDGMQISSTRAKLENAGSYGSDFINPATHTIFFAMGPSIRQGVKLPPFQNVELMNLWTKLLEIKDIENYGEKGLMDLILKKKKHRKSALQDVPDCKYSVTSKIHLCGHCKKGDADKVETWLHHCKESSPLIKPILKTQSLDACYMSICNEGILEINKGIQGKQISIFETYDLQDAFDVHVDCSYVTSRYNENCPILNSTSPAGRVPLSAYPFKGIANHQASHVFLKKGFIKAIFKPLNAYTRVVVARMKRVISITGVLYHNNLVGLDDLPTHIYRILITCPEGWYENGLHCKEHNRMEILSFLFPHMEQDLNCLDRNQLLLQYTARLKDIELLVGHLFQLQNVPEEEMLRLRIHVPFALW